jgi:hypothetical protein
MNPARPPEVVFLLVRHYIGDLHGQSICLVLSVFGKIHPALISAMLPVIFHWVKL